jgi:hypothetical protein
MTFDLGDTVAGSWHDPCHDAPLVPRRLPAFFPGRDSHSWPHYPLEYDTRTHHTNSDTYDRLVPEDLRQAAVIVATMLYNTVMRDQMLPRMPLTP